MKADFDNPASVRTIIDRGLLPPRMAKLVRLAEEQDGPLNENVPARGALEVKHTMALVGGDELVALVCAYMLEEIEVPAEAELVGEISRRAPEERLHDAYVAAAHQCDGICLYLDERSGNYLTYDDDDAKFASKVAEAAGEHMARMGRYDVAVLPLDRQQEWQPKLIAAGLDVTLIQESEGGYAKFDLLDAAPPPEPDERDFGRGREPVLEPTVDIEVNEPATPKAATKKRTSKAK